MKRAFFALGLTVLFFIGLRSIRLTDHVAVASLQPKAIQPKSPTSPVERSSLSTEAKAASTSKLKADPTPDDRVTNWKQEVQGAATGKWLTLNLPGGKIERGIVQYDSTEQNTRRIAGKLVSGQGTFSLGQDRETIEGHVYIPERNLAVVIRTDASGKVVTEERTLSDVLCTPYPKENLLADSQFDGTSTRTLAASAETIPSLNSRSDASAVIYLDFDGETVSDPDWNGGATIVAAPAALSANEISEVWSRVKEDFLPFNINVTTDKAKYTAASAQRRTRVIITPTSSWYPTLAGGVALVDSFSQAGSTGHSSTIPCWVFNSSVSGIAESISHEVGHTLGLHHDGRTTPVEEYYAGHGEGSTSWGPIMGAAYGKTVVQWSKGDYAYANRRDEDDLAIIASSKNGFGYIADDAGDDRTTAASLTVTDGHIIGVGLINSAQDTDYFKVTLPACTLYLSVDGAYPLPNLDVALEVQDSSGKVLASSNPNQVLYAFANLPLPAGTYYFKITGSGRGDIVGDGYVDGYPAYGSIGEYDISATVGAPPEAPTITGQPISQNAYIGNPLNLYVVVNGTSPFTFQWQKNNIDLPNETNSGLYIPSLQASDAGSYRVIVSNVAGSTTSSSATLTLSIPPPPTVVFEPYDQTLTEDSWLSISASANNATSYQWYKDGVSIPYANYSTYTVVHATAADSGKYHAVFTNAGGSISTRDAVISVTPIQAPTINTQPVGGTAERGSRFSFYVYASSNGPVTNQWYKNGQALEGETSNYLTFDKIEDGNSGTYYVVATTKGGSTKSDEITLTVIAPKLPVFGHTLTSMTGYIGSSAVFTADAQSSTPMTFQWYFNGAPITGATSNTLVVTPLKATDAGEYYVAATNAAGTIEGPSTLLEMSGATQSATSDWLDAQENSGVVYFLFQSPAKIARYDLATATWLTDWSLTEKPTAFAVSNDRIFIAFSRTLYKYNKSLSGKTAWANSARDITSVALSDSAVIVFHPSNYYESVNLESYSLSSPVQIDTTPVTWTGKSILYSAIAHRVYGVDTYTQSIKSVGIDSAGVFGSEKHVNDSTINSTDAQLLTLNGGRSIATLGSAVYNGDDLSPSGSAGVRVQDIVDGNDSTYLAASGSYLMQLDAKLRELGRFTLQNLPARIWKYNSTIFAFSQPSSTGASPILQRVAVADIHPPTAPTPLNPAGRKLVIDQTMIDAAGTVYLYSRQDRAVHRWSTGSNRYLPSIPLSARANYVAYSPAHHSIYFDSNPHQIRTIPITGSSYTEYPFCSSGTAVGGIQSVGDYMLLIARSWSWASHYTLSIDGDVISTSDLNYFSTEYIWNPVRSTMYYLRDDISPNDIIMEPIDSTGQIGTVVDSPYHSSEGIIHPLRISTDGSTILLGSGKLYASDTLVYSGTLGNDVSDGVWSPGFIHTIRTVGSQTELQSWSASNYLLQKSKLFDGLPVRIFSINESRLLLITSIDGKLKYYNLTNQLEVIGEYNGSESATKVEGDFNGDGFADVIWQNKTTGDRAIWLMSVGSFSGNSKPLPHMDPNLEIRAVSDFDGDGQLDIVWHNEITTQTGIWLLKGDTHTEVTLASGGPSWSIVGAGDFDGDGKPDIVWENASTGQHAIWRMNGSSFSGQTASLPTVDSHWRVIGVGDFTGDGKADLLWRESSTGAVAIWAMDRTNYSHAVALPAIPASWRAVQVNDFDGNGSVDILWTDPATGQNKIWLFRGTQVVDTMTLPAAGSDWRPGLVHIDQETQSQVVSPITALSDFDGDGHNDLIWQNTVTGERALWLLTKGAYTGRATSLPAASIDIEINAVADFNGDQKPDFVTQNLTTGAITIQLMNGTVVGTTRSLPAAAAQWRIAGAADFNGDLKPDLIWQNRITGQHAIWLMNGTLYSGQTVTLPTVSSNWVIVGTGDFDGDSKADLLWRDTSTGALAIWMMDGSTYRYAVNVGKVSLDWEPRQVCDFNQDGKVDILWQNNTTGDRSVWLMNGTAYSGSNLALPNVSTTWSAGTSIRLE